MVADDLELREQMSAEHRIGMQHDGLRSSRPLEDEAFGRLSGGPERLSSRIFNTSAAHDTRLPYIIFIQFDGNAH